MSWKPFDDGIFLPFGFLRLFHHKANTLNFLVPFCILKHRRIGSVLKLSYCIELAD